MDKQQFQNLDKEQYLTLISSGGETKQQRYKCNLCFKITPRCKGKAIEHVEQCHIKHSKTYLNNGNIETYIIFCKKGCVESGHYHCFVCNDPFKHFAKLSSHISKKCLGKPDAPCSVIDNPVENTLAPVPAQETTVKSNHVECAKCGERVLKKNLIPHTRRKHSLFKRSINQTRYHDGVCIDESKGLYLVVNKLGSGTEYPIHVQKQLHGHSEQVVMCDSKDCQVPVQVAGMSGHGSYECPHAQSLQYVTRPALKAELTEDGLNQLISAQRVKEENKIPCLNLKRKAEWMQEPFICAWEQEKKVFISIWTGEKHSYSPMKRIAVCFDKINFNLTCWCSATYKGCLHKTIAKWFLWTVFPDIFTGSIEGQSIQNSGLHLEDVIHLISEMAKYVHRTFKLPLLLGDALNTKAFTETVLVPNEVGCICGCQILTEVVQKKKGNIFTVMGVKEGVTVWTKVCTSCGKEYWCNNVHGLLNINNSVFLSFDLLEWFRKAVSKHISIGKALSLVNESLNDDVARQSYYKMCSLTELDAAYKCCLCGHFPVVLTFDVIRKAAFFMGELERNDKDGVKDEVDCEQFWRCVEQSIIEESLSGTIWCGGIIPSLEFWAPWIPIQSRRSNEVFNTEYKKGAQEDEHHQYLSSLSEERLEEVFMNGDLKVLRQLCEECGIPCKRMTKTECMTRLKSAIKANCDIDKMFLKIWQGSGGVLTATCPHGIVYALKFLLKAEGVRDAGDILLSLKHPPTVVISDVPHMLAAHINKRSTDFFSLYAGRVDEPSPENIEKVKNHTYGQKSFPWISRMHQKAVSGVNVEGTGIHPITHVTQHLSLYDKFHEGNSKSDLELLRSTSLVKELDGICTETCEQLNADLALDTSFLNSMKPLNYMQMIRMICAVRNNLKNSNLRDKMKNLVGYGKLVDDQFGRLIIEEINSPASGSSSGTATPAPKPSPTPTPEIPVATPTSTPTPAAKPLPTSTPAPTPSPTPTPTLSPLEIGWIDNSNSQLNIETYEQLNADLAPFSLNVDLISSLNGDQNIIGDVIDGIFVILAAELYKQGIKVVVLPCTFFEYLEQDAGMETSIPVDLSDVDFIVAASYFSHHWVLVLVDVIKKRMLYIDPKVNYVTTAKMSKDFSIIRRLVWYYVLGNVRDSAVPAKLIGWMEVPYNEVGKLYNVVLPRQGKSNDCGIFVIMYFYYLTSNKSFDFTQSDCHRLRSWLRSILMSPLTADSSPYLQWFIMKKDSSMLGNLCLKDITPTDTIEKLSHVSRWIADNISMFSALPIDPPILALEKEDQLWWFENEKDDHFSDAFHNMCAFKFISIEDLTMFVEKSHLMGWNVDCEGPGTLID